MRLCQQKMELLSLKFRHRGSILRWNSLPNLVIMKESGDGGVGKSVTSKKNELFSIKSNSVSQDLSDTGLSVSCPQSLV